jgi:hypothetical protein
MRPAPGTAADLIDSGQYRVDDLRERLQRASFSRGQSQPLEKSAHQACGTVQLYRLEDGRLLARRVDCRTKACRKCGPRLRGEYATGYAAVLADGGPVHRLQVADADWRKLQARLQRRDAQALRIPAPSGRVVVYTTAELGDLVADVGEALADDFAAMPSDRRNVSASKAWRQAYHAWRDQQTQAAKAPAEWLGVLRRTLEQVAIIAEDLGMLAGEAGDGALFLRDPPDPVTWQQFCGRAGLYHPRRDQAVEAA